MEISGKTILITGGNSGLGRAAVDYFCQAGGKVAVFDVAEKPAEDMPKSVCYFATDVTDEALVKENIDRVVNTFGSLDICINCAGVAPAKKVLDRELQANPLRDFSKVIDINLIGTFVVCAAAAEKMAANQGLGSGERGVIINTASVAAFDGQKGQCAYAASKGAIVSMTLPMARELSAHGIRVVAIAPGVMGTPMLLGMPEHVQEGLANEVPFPKRLGLPEEFARLAGHVIENAYINAEVIRLDGGLRMSY